MAPKQRAASPRGTAKKASPPSKSTASSAKKPLESDRSLATQLKEQRDESRAATKANEESRNSHVGASINLRAGTGNAKHAELLAGKVTASAGGLKPSSHYETIAKEYDERASALEAQGQEGETMLTRLGDCLKARQGLDSTKISKLDAKSDIVWEWDINHDGKISQNEFRVQMRKLLPQDSIDVHEVDGHFAKWDKDKNGFLDLAELKVGLKQAILQATMLHDTHAELSERAVRVRQIGQKVGETAERTKELELEESTLEAMRVSKGQTVQEKLGLALAKKNTGVNTLSGFDDNGDAAIDAKEFREHVRQYAGITVEQIDDNSLDELHASLDADHNGTLDIDELKESLKQLRVAALKTVGDLTDEADLVVTMRKIVKGLQARTDALVAADKAEMEAVEAAAAQDAQQQQQQQAVAVE